ncbi:MAG: acetyl/propionyl/methylcrotonyl-CoA carboxylase subunit alpha [Alphaproteobacteria bacterium]|nr:acetyl/propionyl/methylcrotonyl-CoA carboxylase subunit alpha [Alphaproteobacteria bacterium]MDE2336582.1 acetyl/propionyl/methylcrotonyl-CoA carboxylase subunit alpha [Alphaproteobacteria bacterium]
MKKIEKILIANRGEIACRVMRTCRMLGIATVAVYSEADAAALHVEMADEAVLIGPAPARESYLDTAKILAAAQQTGADAIHPGYGFLSENAGFAEAVVKAGLVFIGPPASAIRAMGGKSESKMLMEKAKVPLVPGYHGEKQDEKLLKAEAEKIGYPVLIKASAGGGGKGMRVVESAKEFSEALAGAQREAKSSFGNEKVLIEKYLVNPRHVEIQVFADQKGNAVYLFERDCSVQRRHQKVLEEAPAPGLSQATREKMGKAAVAAALAIDYVGAGTVEFLLDAKENFYFMEMNTRLQVEHPVTEMITGLDLVEWQIRVAEGEKLPLAQKDLKINGHAFEARLYAEDPSRDFLPGAGQIGFLRYPMESAQDDHQVVRVDTGVREAPFGDGDVISIYYDPMIAKIISWGKDRAAALKNMQDALDNTYIAGPKTNINFLRALTKNKDFAAGKVNTHFIADHHDALLPEKSAPANETLALAALGILTERGERISDDPWGDLSSWRIGGGAADTFTFKSGEKEYPIVISYPDLQITLPDGETLRADYAGSSFDRGFAAQLDGKRYDAVVYRDGLHAHVMYAGHNEELVYLDPLHAGEGDEETSGRLTAPMPGKVVAVRVKAGAKVTKGQALVIVEAMKMEHTITAPVDGVVAAVNANVGDQVSEKHELIALK